MKRSILTLFLITLWALLVTLSIVLYDFFARPPVTRGNINSIAKFLTDRLSEAEKSKQLGSAAIVLVQNGTIVTEQCFGISDSKSNRSAKPSESLYTVASVSKAIAAWGVMKLVQDGKIGLDEPILPYLKRWTFPGSERYRAQVTIRHLLSHTSGIVDGFGIGGFTPGEPIPSLPEYLSNPTDVNMGASHPTLIMNEPGTTFAYSSMAYAVLELLIEDITALAFHQFMSDSVLRPLGMEKSGYDLRMLVNRGESDNIVDNYDKELKSHPHKSYATHAGVSLKLTAHDLAQFISAFHHNNLLHQASIQQMYEPQPGTFSSWGLGLELYGDKKKIVGHSGGAFPRSGASFRLNPENGNGIGIIMTGGKEMINPYVNAWMYWETGENQFDIRDVLHERLKIALLLITVGAIAILGLSWLRKI